MTRWLGYLIAAQFQAATLIIAAWWVGDWLNREYPKSFNWWLVTFGFAVVAVFQSFYVIIRGVMQKTPSTSEDGGSKSGGGS